MTTIAFTTLQPEAGQAPTLDQRRQEILQGLMAETPQVSPKFLYDALGSRLFDAITELDEYYPTRTEAQIFSDFRAEIAQAVLAVTGPRPSLLDFGAGSCEKASGFFASLQPSRYLPIDISVDYLRDTLEDLQRRHPGIEMHGLGVDFSQDFALPDGLVQPPALSFYPGSSIGNFEPDAARALIARMRAAAQNGPLLIGVDLVKDAQALVEAYDDALGVTAAFNRNLLRHLNRLIEADFDLRQWQHIACYDPVLHRIEMHLESRGPQTVRWAGGSRTFQAGERIHTENAHKWQVQDFAQLLRSAGYAETRCWTDPKGWFAVFLAH